MPNYAPRVSLSFETLQPIISVWAESCEKMAVFEHAADGKTQTTHCHFLMVNCKYATAEALKRAFYKVIDTDLKGNKLWSWDHKDDVNDDLKYITYMTKGKFAASFLKNISPDKVEEAKAQWVNKSPDLLPESSTINRSEFEHILNYLEKKYDGKDVAGPIQMKSDICYLYLSKRKPVPRGSDLGRYAYSAFMIIKSGRARQDRKDDVLKSLITDYIISYESGNIK